MAAMKVRIWGCRGSIPVPGKTCIKYGGNTSCIEIVLDDGATVILDAGTGIRELGQRIMEEGRGPDIYLFLTHSHWDHIMGFPFFKPAYSSHFNLHIRGGPIAKDVLKKYLERQMEPPYIPARFSSLKATFDFTHGIPLTRTVGMAEVIPIPLNHPNGGYGFKVKEGEKTLVYLTDNELGFHHEGGKNLREYTAFCEGADLLLHDAQFTPKEYETSASWGHSDFISAINLAIDARVKRFCMFHHDPDRRDENVDRIGEVAKQVVLKKSLVMDIFPAAEGQELYF
jgi:phosphoribosyl 1,2-cyclic phosphodiesterase